MRVGQERFSSMIDVNKAGGSNGYVINETLDHVIWRWGQEVYSTSRRGKPRNIYIYIAIFKKCAKSVKCLKKKRRDE